MRLLLGLFLSLLAASAWGQAGPTFPAATVNASATIVTGNTFQTILNTQNRRSLTIQNNNTTDSCWIFVGSATASKAASILLTAGQAYTRYSPYVPSDAIQATCANTSDTLYVDYQ